MGRQKPKKKNQKRQWEKVSDHFALKDFTCKSDPERQEFKLSLGLVGGLEMLRSKAQNRVNILKGFESKESAQQQGRVKRNYHRLGVAADITVDNRSLKDIFLIALDIPEFNGIGINVDDNHIHVDTRKGDRKIWVEKDNDEHEISEEDARQMALNIGE